MERKMKISLVVKIAILSASMCTMASDMVIVPILDLLYRAFPDTSQTIVGMAYTIAGIAFIPASLLTPFLCKKYKMKSLMIGGTVLCMIGGGLGGIIHNIYYVILMHFIEGIGAGICTNLIPIYIAKLCANEKEITEMNAWNGVIGTFCGLIAALFSGMAAAAFGWQAAYYVFFVELIVLAMQILFLPGEEQILGESEQEQTQKTRMHGRQIRWVVEVFVIALLINIMWTNQSQYLAEKGLGGADTAGLASSCLQLGGMVSGFILAKVMQKTKSYHQNLVCLIFVLSLGMMLRSTSAGAFLAASFVWGIGQGLFYPYMFAEATLIADNEDEVAGLISWTTIGWYLAVGLTTICYRPVELIFHNNTSTFALTFTMVAFTVVFVYRIFMGTRERKYEKESNYI